MAAEPAPVPLSEEPSITELLAARPHLSMHAMSGLMMEDVPLNRIADALGTPVWVYSAGAIRARAGAFKQALQDAGLDAHLHYAVKANDRLAVLRVIAREGFGADIVSGGEFRRAQAAGIAPANMVFSGVGKTDAELRLALHEQVSQINVESAEELGILSALAREMGATARVALRVNPDVDAGTHTKISTGRAQDKFGIPFADAPALYAHAAALPGITPVGIAAHIGSQITTLAPYRAAFARLADLVRTLRAAGHTVESVDCGGGLGIPYMNEPVVSPAALAGALRHAFHNMKVRLMLEPGRWLLGPAGVLVATVVLVKETQGTRFVVLDAGMNDLVRPAMYEAWHGIVPLSAVHALNLPESCDIVGPVCETGDTFARNRALPVVPRNGRVAILDAGAYGSVMSSAYNARPPAAEAIADGAVWAEIRARVTQDALLAAEHVPPFVA